MSDIFICYARKDIDTAMRLAQLFEKEGWRVFIDKQIQVGRWHKEIEKELHAARAVVVLWSAASRGSDYVLEEAEYGKRKEILFPAFIESVESPYGFSRIQAVNLAGWNGSPTHPEWMALLQSLRLHLNDREKIPVTPEPDKPVQPSVIPSTPIPKPDDSTSGGSKTGSEESTIRKFLLPAALVLLGISIFPMAESIYEDFMQPAPVSTPDLETASAEATEEKAPPIKQEVKASQNQPNTLLDRKLLPELVPIPAGSFNMGEQDKAFVKALSEEQKNWHGIPGKHIQITQPFYLGKTEVTYAQYDYYIQRQQTQGIQVKSPETATGGRGNRPVVKIGWHAAMAYAQWLGEQMNNQCRLPTEAEWEYAARAGSQTVYPWSDKLGSNHANCAGCGSPWDNEQSAPVGSFAANKFGLHDMSGNVWEWTCSNWRDQFDGSEQQCNEDATDTSDRVLRGGSWFYFPDLVRSAARISARPTYRADNAGFRVLCSSPIG